MKKEYYITSKNQEVIKEAEKNNILNIYPKIIEIKDVLDEKKVMGALENGKIYVKCTDWKIIPVENLIAKTRNIAKLIVVAKDVQEADLVLKIMEIGADGVLLETDSIEEVKKLAKLASKEYKEIKLETAEITQIKLLGVGARACIDTCGLMAEGEGMLVGSSSKGMFLVQAEVLENNLVNTRPFRINAGAVSLYSLNENNTNYLQEIKAGDEIMVVNKGGKIKKINVARNKIEIRPMVLIEAKCGEKVAKIILQNAETVSLVTPDGSKQITKLEKGDKVLTYFETFARHLGMQLNDEFIIEQ